MPFLADFVRRATSTYLVLEAPWPACPRDRLVPRGLFRAAALIKVAILCPTSRCTNTFTHGNKTHSKITPIVPFWGFEIVLEIHKDPQQPEKALATPTYLNESCCAGQAARDKIAIARTGRPRGLKHYTRKRRSGQNRRRK